MPHLKNDPDHFGEQFVVDDTGEFIRREQQLLLTSTDLPIGDIFRIVDDLGGLPIPAHVERKAYGIITVLGFIPADIRVEAVEISQNLGIDQARDLFPMIKNYPTIISGDAHRLNEIIGSNVFYLKEPTILEIRKAFRAEGNRSFHTCSV
jgi:3',5'-nucleoside bisphosphate phosphatase